VDLSTGGSAVVQAIVDLARTAGIQTTAEGVETEIQLKYLTSVGCGSVQGYLLARPLAADEVEAYLNDGAYDATLSLFGTV
jgi:EAL domain-containing protein (putative c-di-GMP-specific phosphodiesterase class I)